MNVSSTNRHFAASHSVEFMYFLPFDGLILILSDISTKKHRDIKFVSFYSLISLLALPVINVFLCGQNLIYVGTLEGLLLRIIYAWFIRFDLFNQN